MAVKQKEVNVASAPAIDLELILRFLQEVTFQPTQHNPENYCDKIVECLGTIDVPSDLNEYTKFIADIKGVQDKLAELCARPNLTFRILKTFYNKISSGLKFSPAMSIVLHLVHENEIQQAVKCIFEENYERRSLKNALVTLCTWLTHWTYTDNLAPLTLAFMQGLEKHHYNNILIEVSRLTIKNLFRLIILPQSHKSMAPIVRIMLSQSRQCPDIFHNIIPLVNLVTNQLEKQNTEISVSYLNEIVDICINLMEYVPDITNSYIQLKQNLQPFLPSTNNKLILPEQCWGDENNINTLVPVQCTIGKVGLNNLGNTCYMNSVLQALFMTKTFRNDVLLCDDSKDVLVMWMQILFALLQHSKRTALSPNEILNLVRPPGFQPGHQHDSSEFLGYLLDILHERENGHMEKNGEKAERLMSPAAAQASSIIPSTIVQNVFGGRTISVSSCRECGAKSERADNFHELQLSIPNQADGQSVQTLLDYFLEPENLNGDNKYYCDRCECLKDGERVIRIEQAPKRLILTLKHFRYDPTSHQRTKLLQSIELNSEVHLKNERYELYATVVHCGFSLDFGHYYTFARDTDDWYKFNDNLVTKRGAEELWSLKPPETPYILFYRRLDCADPQSLHRALLPDRLQRAISKDTTDFEEKLKRPTKSPSIRLNRNDGGPPPPGCGGSGIANNSNMFIC